MKTFIRWQGNKSKHIAKFQQFFPKSFDTYIEPFVGSGAVLLHLKPEKWIINDLNRYLISLWKLVRDNPRTLLNSNKLLKNFQKVKN
jgi:DNA adenine methylase